MGEHQAAAVPGVDEMAEESHEGACQRRHAADSHDFQKEKERDSGGEGQLGWGGEWGGVEVGRDLGGVGRLGVGRLGWGGSGWDGAGRGGRGGMGRGGTGLGAVDMHMHAYPQVATCMKAICCATVGTKSASARK